MYSAIRVGALFVLLIVGLTSPQFVFPQGGRNTPSDSGGIHSIRGRIYLPNGQTSETSVVVELQSTTNPSKTTYTDRNGTFSFSSLAPGSYTVVVDAGEPFEIAREYLLIDKEIQGTVRIGPIPKNVNVPIYLQAKRGVVLKNEVLNAKWADIPKATIQHFKRGLELQAVGKDSEAEAEFRKAVDLSPSFAPAHTELGKLAQKSGKLDASIESWRNAIRYDEADFDAHLNLGIAYLNLKKYVEAETKLVNAAFLNRTAVTPHYYLGILFVMKDDLDVARKAFETAKDLKGGKSLPAIHKYLGRIYMAKSMNKEAIAELEAYLNLSPNAHDANKVRKDISDIKRKQN